MLLLQCDLGKLSHSLWIENLKDINFSYLSLCLAAFYMEQKGRNPVAIEIEILVKFCFLEKINLVLLLMEQFACREWLWF